MTNPSNWPWVAWQTNMHPGYYDVVGPFFSMDEAEDFCEARGKNWECGPMTPPNEWKHLYYPWEHPDRKKKIKR